MRHLTRMAPQEKIPHSPRNPPSISTPFPVGMRFAAQALQRDCPYVIEIIDLMAGHMLTKDQEDYLSRVVIPGK